MVEPTLFLFLGSDESEKQKKLELLKKKLFPASLEELNYTILYADEKALSPGALDEALTAIPTAGATGRLVVLKRVHKLPQPFEEVLDKFSKVPGSSTTLVLDIPEPKGAQDLVDSWKRRGAQVIVFKSVIAGNVFDLGRAILGRQTPAALKILGGLYPGRERPEKIIGGLLWQWERSRTDRRLTDEAYAQGIKFLCEADKRLKTSSAAHHQERLILETLVVKLSYLA